MEQMKNKNEYRDGDRLFIDRIKKCTCIEHTGDIYNLDCKIIQRGETGYEFSMGRDYIARDGGKKKLWLLDNSKEAVNDAIKSFNEILIRFKQMQGKPIIICEDNITVIYEHLSWDTFNYLIQKELPDGNIQESYYENHTLRNMIFKISWALDHKYKFIKDILLNSTDETINDNPVYIAALENNDTDLKYHLKLYYNLVAGEDCLWISNRLGVRILPKLSEAEDRIYVVDRNSISDSDWTLLCNSGYQVWHRPYFAMSGSTHTKLELNPHTKYILDASKIDADTITFEAYLKLFEDEAGVHGAIDKPR